MLRFILWLSFASFVGVGAAEASLIGDTVRVEYQCCAIGTAQQGFNEFVDPGNNFVSFFGGFFTANVMEGAISATFGGPNTFDAGVPNAFNGLFVGSLDWINNPNGVVTGLSISTNMAGWDDSRATFDDHSVWFNWDLLSHNQSTFFVATLQTSDALIPEPSTLLLAALALLSLLAHTDRRNGEQLYNQAQAVANGIAVGNRRHTRKNDCHKPH